MANENRLIDANNARVVAQRIYSDPVLIHAILNTLDNTPTVDAAPVVHGRWMIAGRGIRACSECNHGIREHMACVNHYCPNFGARMDGGSDNE